MHPISYLIEYNRYANIVGIMAVLTVAYFFFFHNSHINYRLIAYGLCMQFFIGFLILKTDAGLYCINKLAQGISYLYQFADEGSRFMFGSLVDSSGPWAFIFAIKVLPVMIFFGAFMSLLFHFGIIQHVVFAMNYIVQPILGTSGIETVAAIANSLLGHIEAPLLIRHYLKTMSKSEMLVVMVSGMGTISGSILVVFASMGVPVKHLLTASMMAIPSTLVIAKILYPETQKHDKSTISIKIEHENGNMFDAIASGTSDGLRLAMNVGAMLISFIALLSLLNTILTALCGYSLNTLLAYLFSPVGYLMGLQSSEALAVGQLLGTKIAANEVVAYGEMLSMHLSERTIDIVTYALCGYANFGSIGIQIGGIGALVPEKRKWLAELGLYAVLGGTLSNLLSAMVAGLLL